MWLLLNRPLGEFPTMHFSILLAMGTQVVSGFLPSSQFSDEHSWVCFLERQARFSCGYVSGREKVCFVAHECSSVGMNASLFSKAVALGKSPMCLRLS